MALKLTWLYSFNRFCIPWHTQQTIPYGTRTAKAAFFLWVCVFGFHITPVNSSCQPAHHHSLKLPSYNWSLEEQQLFRFLFWREKNTFQILSNRCLSTLSKGQGNGAILVTTLYGAGSFSYGSLALKEKFASFFWPTQIITFYLYFQSHQSIPHPI